MKIAFYKGPAPTLWGRIVHKVICWATKSKYSHCELIIGNQWYSSSARDGGVRKKQIEEDFKWDIFTVKFDETKVVEWFYNHYGQKYDYAGAFRVILPWLPNMSNRWFCSEALAAALGYLYPENYTPQDLYEVYEDNLPD